MTNIVKGDSVRSLFVKWLKSIGPHGTCLFPEWICTCLPEHAAQAGWSATFVPVLPPSKALSPLALDASALVSIVKQTKVRNVAVLFAHPLGYVDPGVKPTIIKMRKNFPHLVLGLDLAQAYGEHDFRDEEILVDRTFVSFNGRKLLSSGGAIAIAGGEYTHPDWRKDLGIHAQILYAVGRQKVDFLEVEKEWLSMQARSCLHKPWEVSRRSSLHRTVVSIDLAYGDGLEASEILARAEKLGIGQPIHPSPIPQSTQSSSDAYKKWTREVFLLFHQKR